MSELPRELTALKVAMRVEGDSINAYLATIDGKNRIQFASIATSVVALDRDLGIAWREAVIALGMRAIEYGTGGTVESTMRLDPADLETEPSA